MPNLLLQTTIEGDHDDWHIERFSLLKAYLLSLRDGDGRFAFQVTARNRTKRGEPDPVLSKLHESQFDQLWLFAVDVGDGLTPQDCEGIGRFRRRGGSLMVTRDHMDLGSSICNLGGVGAAHHFHSLNCEPDEERHCVDNPFAANISWPNYHSGANGDYQRVRAVGSVHPVMQDQEAADGAIQYLPSHPHEGAVSAPLDDPSARVVVEGQSSVSGRRFNLAVAFERSAQGGRAIAQSTFHHFADYNWDPSAGAPSFVSEPASDGIARFPEALRSTKQYVRNLAFWLGA
ncbi:hypothetical protein C7T35_00150 [Variovorax sp. WS11]|uniref:hypothetical protein n=1 Tax=Variovorax sp. WS11 TaxID=1105204 RepID=UPI000D0DF611|nr:hypothetical protein [Variovorax sp. WS11]NDZ11738.1 hypothetical protein [Variovorax sp. WS11]PSL86430.1 hypothetical protein C7T35_00150 [Variovorax sp. WS11]